MTVEFAVALPVVAIVLTALVAAVLVVDAQGRLQLAAATAARVIGRDDESQGRSVADRIVPGVSVVVRSDGDLVCVDATRGATGPAAALPLTATGCAAARGG
ncbi:pilus assembly protein [Curtobacterium flaccumfaciens pv. oortii]|uniref:TadE family type IV pilus minor pilin n=1 Tax=Curtobacterium flaccumfaciens TaxID=2035 RepID=UPI00265A7365|nr:TadE family protein [Curtobacterium flaccumfaciens]MCS5523505.1 pilus assembly protein [Curtobacterium flaccumfaciens pv. oortii]